MLVKNRIITLLAVMLLMAVCTLSHATISGGWSCYPTYDAQGKWVDQVFDIWWSFNSVNSFQFDLQASSGVPDLQSWEAFNPYEVSVANLGGGLYQTTGHLKAGMSLPPPGMDVNLLDYIFISEIPADATFTVSSGQDGFFELVDANGIHTTLRGNEIPSLTITGPQTVVPEPSSIIALVGGFGSLLAFRRRRA